MLRAVRFLTAFTGALLLVQIMVCSVSGVGDITRIGLEESSAIWGAGTNCHNTYLNGWGCTGGGCTQVQNANAGTDPGVGKITPSTCFYKSGNQILGCGPNQVSTQCQ